MVTLMEIALIYTIINLYLCGTFPLQNSNMLCRTLDRQEILKTCRIQEDLYKLHEPSFLWNDCSHPAWGKS